MLKSNLGSFLLIPAPSNFIPPVKLPSKIIIELIVTTNQIAVFHNLTAIETQTW